MNSIFSKLKSLAVGEKETQEDQGEYWWTPLTKPELVETAKAELAAEISSRVIQLSGHTGSVTCVVHNKRHNTLVTSSFDGTIRIWDLHYKKLLHELQAHDGSVSSLVLSWKTNILVSAGSDGCVKTWDLDEPMYLRTYTFRPGGRVAKLCLTPAEDWVIAAGEMGVGGWAFDTDDEWTALDRGLHGAECLVVGYSGKAYSGHDDGAVRTWYIGEQQDKHGEIGRHDGLVTGVQLNDDQSYLFSCSMDGNVRVWTTYDHQCVQVIFTESSSISAMLYCPAMRRLFIGGSEGEMLVYELQGQFEYLAQHQIHKREILSFCRDDQGNLYSSSMDKVVKIWDLTSLEGPQLVYNFEGHSESVECFAIDHSEKYLASGGMDSLIKIWDLDTRQCISTLTGHTKRVTSLVFARVREVLFSGSDDATIKMWTFEFDNFKLVLTIHEHTGPVNCLAINSKFTLLASGGADSVIRLWNMSDLSKKGELVDHIKGVMSLVFEPNGKYLFSAGVDATIKIWSLKKNVCLDTFLSHMSMVYKIVYCPIREAIFSASRDKTIAQISVIEKCQKKKYVGHKDEVLDITVSRDGNTLYSGSRDKTIKIWSVNKAECLTTLLRHTEPVTMIHQMGRFPALISASEDKSIILWNFETPNERRILDGHSAQITSIQLQFADQVLVSSSDDGKIIFRSISDNRILRSLEIGTPICAFSSVSGDDVITVATRSNGIHNWSISEQVATRKVESSTDNMNTMISTEEGLLLFSATAISPYYLQVAHRNSGHMVRDLEGHTKIITSLSQYLKRNLLFSGSADRTIRVWDLTNQSCIHTLKGHSEAVNAIVTDPQGTFLYTGSSDRTIRVWQLEDFSMMTTLTGHEGEVLCLTIANKSPLLFSGGTDNMILIWSTIDFRLICKFTDISSNVTSLTITSDDDCLYSGHHDGTIRMWELTTFTDVKGLNLNLLQNLQRTLIAESSQERLGSLHNFLICLRQSENEHYIHRVFPALFTASLPFTDVLKTCLSLFKYPSLHSKDSEELFGCIIKDDERRNNHLDTIAEYLYEHPESIRLSNTIVHQLIPNPNLKLQTLLTKMFELNPEPQQGAFLQTKGVLRQRPNCVAISNTRLVSSVSLDCVMRKETGGQTIKYVVMRLPLDLRNGCEASRDFLRGLQECGEEVILSQFKHVINYKWKSLRSLVLIHATGFWILCMSMSLYIFYVPGNFYMMIYLLILNGIYIAYEITGAIGELFSYIFQDMNWVDLAVLSMNSFIVVVFYSNPNNSYIYILVLIDFLMYFLRAITFLRVFQSTRYLISTILKVFADISSLMLISFLFLFGMSMIAVNLSYVDDDPETTATFWGSFQPLYTLFAGDIDTSQVINYYDRVQYFVASVILKLVMYNLNISIVENAYKEVKSNREYFELMEKLQIVGDFENFLYKLTRRKSRPSDYKYHLLANYPEKETDESLLAALYKQILQLEKHLLSVFEVIEEKLETTYQMLRVNRKNGE